MTSTFAFARLIFAATVMACVALPAFAQRDDKKAPINYSADTGDVNYQTKVGNLAGNVIITQGTMTIRADRIKFRQNADNSISATAFGNPITFRQKRDGSDEYYEGFAQRAEYDGEKEQLELFDRALLKRGQDEIRSNYISYNTKTELFRAEGRPDAPTTPADAGPGARVRGIFQPKDDKGESKLPGSKSGDKSEKSSSNDKAGADAKPAAAKPAPLPLKAAGEMAPAAK
ncbi:MAG TPA: lipopolysaccharide transport periplasmic protein LptA [Casimicrobiaceae bacterium]|nr:lipopolysaccharide transport periplasmic protein LptA [Casimicrobiaceae bacterium]